MEANVKITSLAFGSRGIGRIDGKVVFVPFAAPGDEVKVEVTSEKKGFSEGVIKELLTPSPIRKPPECVYFGVCGGCSLQHIGYNHQVEWKQRIFEESLRRIGGVGFAGFDSPVPSPKEFNYRSRAGFHVEGRRWGFFEARSHRVVEIEECPLLDQVINSVYKTIRERFSGEDLRPLYSVEIGVSALEKKAAAAFYVSEDTGLPWKELLTGAGLKGFEVRLSPSKKGKGKRIIAEDDSRLSYGAGGCNIVAPVSVFSQTNPLQNGNLLDKVLEYAGLTGKEDVLDLFCGAGNLTLPLAKKAGQVLGIEADKEAVKAAKNNALFNNAENADFICEDSFGWLNRSFKALERRTPDVVVLDPPRGGEPQAAKALSGLRPKRIIYVSCNPPTLARDISLLSGCGYRVYRAALIDMFPQTFHIEGVLGLELAG
ncbi:MAG: class I SAM-dependent RNA methyltransferase [Deltaproteobacteria bacterium]|nr:class I SAM-dependent RNA methyltransferase [Deltaproteobacteria bacterium]